METIKLETSDYGEVLRDRLKFELEVLQQEGLEIKFDEYQQEETIIFVFKLNSEEEKVWAIIKEYIANAVSDVIINQFEERQLAQFLRTNYQEFSPEERKQILKFAYERLNSINSIGSEMTATLRRKNQVANKILSYLTEKNKINLEGFTEFRLKEYIASLKLAVEEAVDEYLIEQEYQEFIGLLEDIIGEQAREQHVINVIRTENNNFQLADETGVQLENDWLEEHLPEGTEVIKTEDKLISVLISIAPQEVILHFKEPTSVVEILRNIFEDDLSICMGCKFCQLDKFKQ